MACDPASAVPPPEYITRPEAVAFKECDPFYSNQGAAGTCTRHAIAKAVHAIALDKGMFNYLHTFSQLRVPNSSCSLLRGGAEHECPCPVAGERYGLGYPRAKCCWWDLA